MSVVPGRESRVLTNSVRPSPMPYECQTKVHQPVVPRTPKICGNPGVALLNPFFLLREKPFDLQCSHAAAASTRDGLSVPFVLDVTCCKDTLDASLCCAGYGDDVTLFVCVQLVTDQGGSGFVPNGVEETIDRKVFCFACEHVLDAEIVEKVAVSLALSSNRVPKDGLHDGKDEGSNNATLSNTVCHGSGPSIRTILGLFIKRLAMILEARSSPLRTRT